MLEIIAAASDDEGGLLALLAAGPVGGAATYWAIYRYYRNTDKSHQYERDTIVESDPVRGGEGKVGEISKTRKRGIPGDNSDDYRRRVYRVT